MSEVRNALAMAWHEAFREARTSIGQHAKAWSDLDEDQREAVRRIAGGAIARLDGFAIVPKVATKAMLHAATMEVPTWDDEASRRKWSAMLTAAGAKT